METWLFIVAGGLAAGVFGSLLGLGGGILIVPLLTLGLGIPLRDAVGVSLICVAATSAASGAVYLRSGAADLRLAMTLELFSAAGAIVGGVIAFALDERWLAALFAALLLGVALSMVRRRAADATDVSGSVTARDKPPRRLRLGAAGGIAGGIASGVLGIGGGIVLVPLMHMVMGLPLRVAAATSGVMIAVTASAGGIVYLVRGGIEPYVLAPTALGVFIGAMTGARVAPRVDLRILRALFVVVLGYLALRMLGRALGLT